MGTRYAGSFWTSDASRADRAAMRRPAARTAARAAGLAGETAASGGEWSPAGAAAYWERRAGQFAGGGEGLGAVCSYGMPAFYNHYIQRCQRRALLPWLPPAAAPLSRALDVGCGVGRWSLELAARGYQVTGVDVSASMIEQAQIRAARQARTCKFIVSDAAEMRFEHRFEFIVCVTVLQHILDPQRAAGVIRDMAALLTSGGRLVLLEAAPTRLTERCDTAVFQARPAGWYREALQAGGLELLAQCGVDPMPLKTWLLPHYRRLPPMLGTAGLALTTALSLPLDWLLARRLGAWSWHKVFVAGRPRQP